MSQTASLLVAVVDPFVCVKIAGRANFTCSVDFKKLIAELSQRGYKQFLLDLSECILMDSTFLGVLAGIGLKFGQKNGAVGDGCVELLNPNPRISELLESLGVVHLFRIVHRSSPVAEGFQAVPADGGPVDRMEVTRTCLEAHNILMNVNPENVRRFKDVARFLSEDLKKMETTFAQKKQ